MITVLLVDDEPVLLDVGRMFLERSGEFRVSEAASGMEALERLHDDKFDAIVADYEMPEMDGLALLRKVRTTWPDLPYILFTGRGREEVVIEALNSGADFYLQKGGDPKTQFTELADKIKQAIITRKGSPDQRENEETYRQFFDGAGYAICILDGDTIADINKKGLNILARNRDQVLGKNLALFSTPVQPDGKDILYHLHAIREEVSAEEPHIFVWRILRADNSWIDTEVCLTSVMIHGRRLLHAIIRDISARKQQEEAARINEISLQVILDLYSLPDYSLKKITDFALEQIIAITRSLHGYLAFVNEDESVLTMYSWSAGEKIQTRILEKPISYMVADTGKWGDAVRHRQPVITNNYETEPTGRKELPDFFHPLHRHMNVPIFDRDRIVLLVGVVNKQESYTEEDMQHLRVLMTGMWGIIKGKKTEEILYKKNSELMVAYEQLRTIEAELRQKYEEHLNCTLIDKSKGHNQ